MPPTQLRRRFARQEQQGIPIAPGGPRRTGRIKVTAIGLQDRSTDRLLYLGNERRQTIGRHSRQTRERRSGFDRRSDSTDFLKSVILGRRRDGMSSEEISRVNAEGERRRARIEHPDLTNLTKYLAERGNYSTSSRIGSAIDHAPGESVSQTTRRWHTSRRTVGDRRSGKTTLQREKKVISVEWASADLQSKGFVARGRRLLKKTGNHRKGHNPLLIVEE